MGAGNFECIWVRIFVRLRNRYNTLSRTVFEIYIYIYIPINIYIFLVACLCPGRIVCMFSLNEFVKGGSRKSSSGTSWLKQLGPIPSSPTRSLRDLGRSHLKTLCASVSLSVTTGCYTQRCGWGSLRPAEHRKEQYEPHTPLLAEPWTGLFSKTVPSPAGIVKSRSLSVECSGKDWKVESAHCLSSVTVEMWVGYDFSQLRDFCIVVSLFCVLEKKNFFEIISTNMETDIWLCWSEILFVHNKNDKCYFKTCLTDDMVGRAW